MVWLRPRMRTSSTLRARSGCATPPRLVRSVRRGSGSPGPLVPHSLRIQCRIRNPEVHSAARNPKVWCVMRRAARQRPQVEMQLARTSPRSTGSDPGRPRHRRDHQGHSVSRPRPPVGDAVAAAVQSPALVERRGARRPPRPRAPAARGPPRPKSQRQQQKARYRQCLRHRSCSAPVTVRWRPITGLLSQGPSRVRRLRCALAWWFLPSPAVAGSSAVSCSLRKRQGGGTRRAGGHSRLSQIAQGPARRPPPRALVCARPVVHSAQASQVLAGMHPAAGCTRSRAGKPHQSGCRHPGPAPARLKTNERRAGSGQGGWGKAVLRYFEDANLSNPAGLPGEAGGAMPVPPVRLSLVAQVHLTRLVCPVPLQALGRPTAASARRRPQAQTRSRIAQCRHAI